MGTRELFLVDFFAKVEMRGDGVLEEVHQQISQQDKKAAMGGIKPQAFGHHLYQSGGQHEPGAERYKVLEIAPVPVLLDDDGTAYRIGQRRRQTQQHAYPERLHREKLKRITAAKTLTANHYGFRFELRQLHLS